MIDALDKKMLESKFADDFASPYYPMLAELYLNEGDVSRARKVCEIGLGYDINESLKSYLAVSQVFGDDSQDDKYTFNHMEDFSHIRLELKYYY